MNKGNINKILKMIKPTDKVLDIGGWCNSFNRATHVIDINPYETREKEGQSCEEEQYSKDTWLQRDICDREPFPFPDKYFDFVFCSHTLEDIRDPIWVCSEINRIAKKGYIEVPSYKYEMSRGVEGIYGRKHVGNTHHRWVIFVEGNKISFRMKNHFLSGEKRYSIPYNYYKRMRESEKISFIFFDDTLEFEEKYIFNDSKCKKHFEDLVRDLNCRSGLFWLFDDIKRLLIVSLVKIKKMFLRGLELTA